MKCKECMFYEKNDTSCHKYAPKETDGKGNALWPFVEEGESCGEFRPNLSKGD